MSDSVSAADVAPAPVIESEPISLDQALSADGAADLLQSMRKKPAAESADEPATAEAEESSSQKDDGDPRDEAHAEKTKEAEPEEKLPPIEPPRFWTSDAKERFNSLPRETQQYIVEREQARDAEVRRTQNESAERGKSLDSKLAETQKSRDDFVTKAEALSQMIQNFGPFADIKTHQDVINLQRSDPFRFQEYLVHRDGVQQLNNELASAKQQQSNEHLNGLRKYESDELVKVAEALPELKDPEKLNARIADGIAYLKTNYDISQDDIRQFATEGTKPFILSAAFQLLTDKAMKYDALQKAKVEAVKKPVPPVQRPGVAAPRGAASAENVQTLSRKLETSGSVDDALALLLAQRKAS